MGGQYKFEFCVRLTQCMLNLCCVWGFGKNKPRITGTFGPGDKKMPRIHIDQYRLDPVYRAGRG